MLTHMTQPTAEQTRGYDIVIWADNGGCIMANSYTILGEAILHGLLPSHRMGEPSEIIGDDPQKFFEEIPRGTNVGLVDVFTQQIFTFIEGHGGVTYRPLH